MQNIYKLIGSVSTTPNLTPVLLLGESGTGKELVARAIHSYGAGPDQPFVGVNCTAVPETLLESELFGYEKGAFTGASERKPGKFEIAKHGTIFLDEIGDLSPMLQQKLLRVLQERQFERLGSNETLEVGARARIKAVHGLELDVSRVDGQKESAPGP
jgi:transcriptional regulator with GAF, ATPase, and Fis domain